uniref:NADH-ubiquinone oxidoreductase chain 4 n=1 Tax=Trachipterus trachypterus TaxID=143894 RepID=Q94T58_TRATA|nr:NADH dehydrogenase subunit 4 [Trachipterus trachypterus]UOU84634.1 NADH dehydrogenase subunit 4 [Trachipterus trachypterus]UOU84647.1 NADH dehydrogenase subunit 4 [Trachipterus trachypterus]UOU84660.1 NADH dehydrogenase subunit 4 [Trachipterus trachypterus]BAB70114.1 NADH dehydrogenase subunit 4 [Trachipterus trachypterus]
MLKILLPSIMLLPTIWLTPFKWVWTITLGQTMLIALASFMWFNLPSETGWTMANPYLAVDALSSPLLILTCWLLPLMVLASQNHLKSEPAVRQRTFLSLLVSLQILLIMAFSATELILFYIMFEATLIPTLLIITRWGNQAERLNAGTYFLFYTLAGSLPLLVALLLLQNDTGTLSMLTLPYSKPMAFTPLGGSIWWTACLLAFLVKMPLYGVHLWLPKAHVEAPIAGSMVLAAVLLKLGGYGMIRIMVILEPVSKNLVYPFIIFALWGVVMTGSICLRQTDLKSLIAYSSVGHMGLVVAGILTQTPWGLTGAVILMIAHGLTSSALFCLANTNYERTHSRTMLLARGLQSVFPLLATWWFLTTLANLALPPLPNLMGELMIMTSMFNWSPFTLILTGAGAFITAAYSLHMFITTQRGGLPLHLMSLDPTHTREHILIVLHIFPLFMLMVKPELIWGWLY